MSVDELATEAAKYHREAAAYQQETDDLEGLRGDAEERAEAAARKVASRSCLDPDEVLRLLRSPAA